MYNVLICDDQPDIVNALKIYLKSEGYQLFTAYTGKEAVEIVIEAKDNNDDLFLGEAADLMYHYLILLKAKGFKLEDVENILKSRENGPRRPE